MHRVASHNRSGLPPRRASLARAGTLTADMTAIGMLRHALVPELALANALSLESMAYGLIVGAETPDLAAVALRAPQHCLEARLPDAEELVSAVEIGRTPEQALYVLAAAAVSLAHRVCIDWRPDPWAEVPQE